MSEQVAERVESRFPSDYMFDELGAYARRLLLVRGKTDALTESYWNGVFEGHLAGLGVHPDADVAFAPYPLASPCVLSEAVGSAPSFGDNAPRYAWSCGYLSGFKYATEDRADAQTCSGCDRRILTDEDDYSRCNDVGYACNDECLRLAHTSGRLCAECPEDDDHGYRTTRDLLGEVS